MLLRRTRGRLGRCARPLIMAFVLLGVACEDTPRTPSSSDVLSVNGVPLECHANIARAACMDRARTSLTHSLPPGHPPVLQVAVTCEAEVCDANQGPGQVVVHFRDGTEQTVVWGFGRTR